MKSFSTICVLSLCIAAVLCRPPIDQEKQENSTGKDVSECLFKEKAPDADTENIALGIAQGLLKINNAWVRAKNGEEDIMSAGKEISEGLGKVSTGLLDGSIAKMQKSATEFAEGIKNVATLTADGFMYPLSFRP